eukprot:scaffold310978_cov55-Attheya_sp.AAC.1
MRIGGRPSTGPWWIDLGGVEVGEEGESYIWAEGVVRFFFLGCFVSGHRAEDGVQFFRKSPAVGLRSESVGWGYVVVVDCEGAQYAISCIVLLGGFPCQGGSDSDGVGGCIAGVDPFVEDLDGVVAIKCRRGGCGVVLEAFGGAPEVEENRSGGHFAKGSSSSFLVSSSLVLVGFLVGVTPGSSLWDRWLLLPWCGFVRSVG